jgi:hypothetical protein
VSPKIIISEGDHDDAFLENLIRVRGLKGFHFVKPSKPATYGVDGFQLRLSGLAANVAIDFAACPHLLVVADNDDAPRDQFVKVRKALRLAGWDEPKKVRETVAYGAGEGPPASVLMLPWDDDPGCLETLCYISASAHRRKVAACVESLVACVGAGSWPIAKLSKLKMRCFLASVCEKDPNTGLQYAWPKDDKKRPTDLIPLENKCFDKIVDYLQTL